MSKYTKLSFDVRVEGDYCLYLGKEYQCYLCARGVTSVFGPQLEAKKITISLSYIKGAKKLFIEKDGYLDVFENGFTTDTIELSGSASLLLCRWFINQDWGRLLSHRSRLGKRVPFYVKFSR